MVDMINEALISGKECSVFIKNNLIDSDGMLYLTVDSLIEINNKIAGSNILF